MGEESPVDAKICVLLERWIGVRRGKEERGEETERENATAWVSGVRSRRFTVEVRMHVSRKPVVGGPKTRLRPELA